MPVDKRGHTEIKVNGSELLIPRQDVIR